ncbi:hypothetical protein AAF712_002559 [Marasmius tenuissimus]|uniref:Uncharacterized protein n=1 Tax=Marasmius tenuissimus TaxID=585030 RepID=A0ABR3ABI2_9AGAR
MNETLGARQGSRHSSVDLQKDIGVLMKNLQEHQVYEVQNGRTVDDDDSQIFKDNVTAGIEALTTGSDNPLTEYNRNFRRLQKRRRMPPVKTDPTPAPAQQQNDTRDSNSTASSSIPVHDHTTTPSLSASTSVQNSCQPPNFDSADPSCLESLLPGIEQEGGHNDDVETEELVSESCIEEENLGAEFLEAENGEEELMFEMMTESDVELNSGDEEDELANDFGETDSEDEDE